MIGLLNNLENKRILVAINESLYPRGFFCYVKAMFKEITSQYVYKNSKCSYHITPKIPKDFQLVFLIQAFVFHNNMLIFTKSTYKDDIIYIK